MSDVRKPDFGLAGQRATRCHRQFATIAAHEKISLSAEPLALSSRSLPAASRIVIAAKNRDFNSIHPYRSFVDLGASPNSPSLYDSVHAVSAMS
jgi:hypothetical protein